MRLIVTRPVVKDIKASAWRSRSSDGVRLKAEYQMANVEVGEGNFGPSQEDPREAKRNGNVPMVRNRILGMQENFARQAELYSKVNDLH